VNGADLIHGSHVRMAEVRVEANRLDGALDRLWRHYEKAQADLREVGGQHDLLLSPQLEAAYAAWRQHGPRDARLALTIVGEAPVGEEAGP
jgi:hypothetical protein